MKSGRRAVLAWAGLAAALGCSDSDSRPPVACAHDREPRCSDGVAETCEEDENGLRRLRTRDCAAEALSCVDGIGCAACEPGARECLGPDVVECGDDGVTFQVVETCDRPGEGCATDSCTNLCALAAEQGRHTGCDFVLADLDNPLLGSGTSMNIPFGIAVTNANPVPVAVEVHAIDSGANPIAHARVAAGDAVLLTLPNENVDGASGPYANDGTHSALTPSGYRVTAELPVGVTMFNPLSAESVSSDASLLLPVAALGSDYVVTGWPQTIADDDDPRLDFNPDRDDEDLRAFLTLVAAEDGTRVEIELGPDARLAVDGDVVLEADAAGLEVELDALEVLNLESDGYGKGFGGTRIHASRPVAAFTGAEATDIPTRERGVRQCCADHLEAQLLPDAALGTRYAIAHSPNRAAAINAVLAPGYPPLVVTDEPDFIRVVAPQTVQVRTTLDHPYDEFELEAGVERILLATRDFVLEASGPVAVSQGLGSQATTYISNQLPGGDPSLLVPAAIEHHTREFVFATPPILPFCFVVVSAPASAELVLDGDDARERCEVAAIEGDDAWRVYRCPLSRPTVDADFWTVTPDPDHRTAHVLHASEPVGAYVVAFGRFGSYAYTAGLELGER